MVHGMWDLSSLTRDQTRALYIRTDREILSIDAFILFYFKPQSGKKRNQHSLKSYYVLRTFPMFAPLIESGLH